MQTLRAKGYLPYPRRKGAPRISTSVSSTVCRSKVERLITLSMSAVAVCCCRDFAQLVEQARVLYGDDGLLSEVAQELDMLVAEWFDLLAEDQDRADELVILKHRHGNYRPITA